MNQSTGAVIRVMPNLDVDVGHVMLFKWDPSYQRALLTYKGVSAPSSGGFSGYEYERKSVIDLVKMFDAVGIPMIPAEKTNERGGCHINLRFASLGREFRENSRATAIVELDGFPQQRFYVYDAKGIALSAADFTGLKKSYLSLLIR